VDFQRVEQPQSQLGVVNFVRTPRMRSRKVLALLVKWCKPCTLISTAELQFGPLRGRDVQLQMVATRWLAVAGLVQSILCILANRFQHSVASRSVKWMNRVREP
jgi:hypothetical protein